MKIKDTMIKNFSCQLNELGSLSGFLEKQTAKGWELTDIKGSTFGFRRAEPRTVQINAEIVYPDDNYEQKEEFVSFCRTNGWKHIYDAGKIQIFENEDLHAEPIHTDPEVKLKAVHSVCMWHRLIAPTAVALLGLFFWYTVKYNMDYYDYMNTQKLVIAYGMPIILILLGAEACDYLLWFIKAKKAVYKGNAPVYRKTRFSVVDRGIGIIYLFFVIWGGLLLNVYYSGDIKWMVFAVGAILATAVLILTEKFRGAKQNHLKKTKASRFIIIGTILLLIAIFWIGHVFMAQSDFESGVIHEDKLALTLSDLGIETDGVERYGYKEGSPLLKREYGDDMSENESGYKLYFEVHRARTPELRDLVMSSRYAYISKGEPYRTCVGDGVTAEGEFEEVTDTVFHADKIYYHDNEWVQTWLLICGNDIYEIETNFKLTDEQKEVIVEKLKMQK